MRGCLDLKATAGRGSLDHAREPGRREWRSTLATSDSCAGAPSRDRLLSAEPENRRVEVVNMASRIGNRPTDNRRSWAMGGAATPAAVRHDAF